MIPLLLATDGGNRQILDWSGVAHWPRITATARREYSGDGSTRFRVLQSYSFFRSARTSCSIWVTRPFRVVKRSNP
jgi:hypothetical protein